MSSQTTAFPTSIEGNAIKPKREKIDAILQSYFSQTPQSFHAAAFASITPTLTASPSAPSASPPGSTHQTDFYTIGTEDLPPSTTPVTEDSLFWVASLGKIVTVLGVLKSTELFPQSFPDGLDTDVTAYLPPICSQVLQTDGSLTPKTGKITLRMLLSHTSGFAYEIMSPPLVAWKHQSGKPLCMAGNFTGAMEPYEHPLVFEPGQGWSYGPGVDWAGRIVEKISGLSLEIFLQKYISTPLGIAEGEMSFSPDPKRVVQLTSKSTETGILEVEKNGETPPTNPEDCLGGIGLFSTPKAFMKVLDLFLNGGDGNIIAKATLDEIFSLQIPAPEVKLYLNGLLSSDYMVQSGMRDALSKGEKIEGGLGCFLGYGGTSRRGEGTISGMGLPNCSWWVDREKGVAGAVFLSVMPALDQTLAEMVGSVERVVYEGL